MKKLTALLLVFVMLFALSSASMADGDDPRTLSYIYAKRAIEANELTGGFYQVGDLDMDLWVPDLLSPEENIPNDCYWLFRSENGDASVTVHAVGLESGSDLDSIEKTVTYLGSESDGVYWINNFDALIYETKDDDSHSVVIPTADDHAVEFVFEPISNRDVYSLASMILSTIQPHALDVGDAAMMMDADLNNIWGPAKHVSYAKDVSSITVNMWDEGINADTLEHINNWADVRQDKIEIFNLYVRSLKDLGLNDALLTLQYTDEKEERSFLTIEGGEITYDAFSDT